MALSYICGCKPWMAIRILSALLFVLDPIRETSGFYAQPEAVYFLESPSDVVTCEGCGPIELICTIPRQNTVATDLVPHPTLHWTINGTPFIMSDESALVELVVGESVITSTLTMLSPQQAQSGMYRCVASDGIQATHCGNLNCVSGITLSNSALVQVLGNNATKELVNTTDCSTTVLRCGSKLPQSANARVSIKWMKNTYALGTAESEQILLNGDLFIYNHGNTNVTPIYTCIAEFQNTVVPTTVIVGQYELHTNTSDTNTRKRTIQLAKNKSVYYTGDTVELVCGYTHLANNRTHCNQPHLLWYMNGDLKNSTPQNSNHSFKLHNVTATDSGRYCCRVDFDDGEIDQDCTQVFIMDRASVGLTHPTRYITGETRIELTLSYPMVHHSLVWFHNGIQLEQHKGSSSLNLTSSENTDLYGVYQCFITLGVQTQILLTRYMPYGLSNPPGRPVLSAVPWPSSSFGLSAVKVEWAYPVYSGGRKNVSFNIYDRSRGLLESVIGNSAVLFLHSYYSYNIYISVVSNENRRSVSESSLITYFYNEGACADTALYPPLLSLACQSGRVTISWEDNPSNPRLGKRVFYLAGGCFFRNETVFLPPGSSQSPATLIPVMEVGTPCVFEGATASQLFSSYRLSDRYCYDPQHLQYTAPVECTVTASLEFEQVEYSVQEEDLFVEVCVSGHGYGFNITVGTLASTATAIQDFEPVNQYLEFRVAENGPVTQCVNVRILEDEFAEEDESFHVVLTAEDPNVVILTNTAEVIIMDNDYVNVSLSHPFYTSLENDSSVLVCLSASDNLRKDVVIRLNTTEGNATEGLDYVGLHTEVILSAVNRTTCIPFNIIEDSSLEETESFFVTLSTSEPKVTTTIDTAMISIQDNDYIYVTFAERDMMIVSENTTSSEVCVAIVGTLEKKASVSIATGSITATEGADYTGVHIDVNLNTNVSTFCIDLTVMDDSTLENNEQFNLVLMSSDPSVHVLGGILTVQIVDNDYVEVMLSSSQVDIQWPEKTFNVCIETTGGRMDRSVDVQLLLLSNNATVPSLFHYDPRISVEQSGLSVCTRITIIVGTDSERVEVDFRISSEDPGVLFSISNSFIHVVYTGEVHSEKLLSTSVSVLVGVLLGGSAVIIFATLLLICIMMTWMHHLKQKYERQMTCGLSKNDMTISDFYDPVSVDPDPLYSKDYHSDDEITLYNEYCFSGVPNNKLSAFPGTEDKFGDNVSQDLISQRTNADVLYKQTVVTPQQIIEHLQRHSLLSDYFQKETDGEFANCLESENLTQLSQGHGSGFSSHSSSQYVHFDQCNCRCKDCSTQREGKLSVTLDMKQQNTDENNTVNDCVPSTSSLQQSLTESQPCISQNSVIDHL